jgi:hypothetical protein
VKRPGHLRIATTEPVRMSDTAEFAQLWRRALERCVALDDDAERVEDGEETRSYEFEPDGRRSELRRPQNAGRTMTPDERQPA